jgi:TIR domain-containing protein
VATPRVFINYRREDASGHAGRLYDALAERLGSENVFMDVDAIRPGENFAQVLDESVESCDVLIALIGRRWASAVDREGRRRLERPEDYVRLELRTALESPHTRVIPALVQGAEMTTSDQLPPELRDLSMRQAIELSDARWRSDVERLIRDLAPESPSEGDRDTPSRRGWAIALVVAGIAAAVIAVALVVTHKPSPSPSSSTVSSTASRPKKPAKARASSPPTVRYAIHSTTGYQAQLPAGDDWTKPSDAEPVPGRIFRTTVRNPSGAFVIIDYTPQDRPVFGGGFDSKRTVGQTAFGSATEYVFRGGKFPECQSSRCIDYQISVPPGGLAVLAGGPNFAQTQSIARTVTDSLTAPSAG